MHRWSAVVARPFGIELRIHATFLILVALFAASAGAEDGLGLAGAMVWLTVIFSCVTLHELAHSLVARSRGIPVRAIVLLPIGGVSEMERLPDDPRDEFAIAIVGPATSLGIAAAAFALAVAAGNSLWPPNLYDGPILARTAWLNLVLGGFNLLPAFPLDGGRVFRSLLERGRSLVDATRVAARAGRALAVGMVVVGVLWNPWLLLIGMFVYFGASAEEAATVLHARLKGMQVRDVMLEGPIVVDAGTSIGEVAMLARHTAQEDFPVQAGDDYLGMLTEELTERTPASVSAGSVAVRDVPVVDLRADLETVGLPALARAHGGAVAVVDEGTVVGLLHPQAVGRALRRLPTA